MKSGRRHAGIWVDVLLTGAAVVLVAAPILFTDSGFALDFTNHLWLSWIAGKSLAATGHPSYFLNAPGLGVFYPLFAFYGGTLYTVTGALSELLGGNAVLAYIGVTLLAIAGCYGGMLWLGRQLGLRGPIAHVPALVVVTSAYYITNLYGRGAWPELVAVSAIAPLLASALHLVRARTWRPWPVLVFVVAAVLFTGSHNITLVWGSTVALLALVVTWLALGAPRRLPYRRLSMVAGLGGVCALVNSWFLLPDIVYQGYVKAYYASHFSWAVSGFFDTPGILLDPLRAVPEQSTRPALFMQAPDLFLVWGLAAGGMLLAAKVSGHYGLRRVWVGAVTLVALLLGAMMLKPVWSIVPYPFIDIQFPYRLDSYLAYGVAGLVLVGALALQHEAKGRKRRLVTVLRLALVASVAIGLGLCVWQQWVPSTRSPKSIADRSEALAAQNVAPLSWYDEGTYRDARSPVVTAAPNRTLLIKPSQVRGDRFEAWMSVPPGPAPIQTDIGGGDYLVHISGLEWIGRDELGYAVVRRVNGGSGPVRVVLETAHSFTLELGRILSIVAIVAIACIVVGTAVRGHGRGGGRAPLGVTRDEEVARGEVAGGDDPRCDGRAEPAATRPRRRGRYLQDRA
jgi:hypothetical protein